MRRIVNTMNYKQYFDESEQFIDVDNSVLAKTIKTTEVAKQSEKYIYTIRSEKILVEMLHEFEQEYKYVN